MSNDENETNVMTLEIDNATYEVPVEVAPIKRKPGRPRKVVTTEPTSNDGMKVGDAVSTARIVLVRTYSAGVHVGELVSRNGKEVVLKDAHRVWCWRGANTLHELSQKGASQEHTRISERVPTIELTEAVEIIDCSTGAATNLRMARWSA